MREACRQESAILDSNVPITLLDSFEATPTAKQLLRVLQSLSSTWTVEDKVEESERRATHTNHLKYGFAYEQSVLVHLAVKHSVSTTVKEFCLICDIYFLWQLTNCAQERLKKERR